MKVLQQERTIFLHALQVPTYNKNHVTAATTTIATFYFNTVKSKHKKIFIHSKTYLPATR